MKRFSSKQFLEQYLVLLSGAVLFIYLIQALFFVPYLAFMWHTSTHDIYWIDPKLTPSEKGVQAGDKLVRIGDIAFEAYARPTGPSLVSLITPENKLPLQVERDGRLVDIQWPVQPLSPADFAGRILNFMPALICLAAALVVQLFLRPKNLTRRLLLLVLCLAVLWLATGARNDLNMPLADPLYSLTVCLWMPALLHLMWVYPYPLGKLPGWLAAGFYLAAGLLGLATVFSLVPRYTYLPFFAASILAGLLLFGLHFFLRRKTALA